MEQNFLGDAGETWQRLNQVVSKETLAEFLDYLRRDLELNVDGWENPTLDRFLESLAAYLRVEEQINENLGLAHTNSPTWRTFAEILAAGKVYE